MDCIWTISSREACRKVTSQIISGDITSHIDCYIGGEVLDTVQLTAHGAPVSEVQSQKQNPTRDIEGFAVGTCQLTVQSTTSGEVNLQTHNPLKVRSSEVINSTIGTYEVTQLKERLA